MINFMESFLMFSIGFISASIIWVIITFVTTSRAFRSLEAAKLKAFGDGFYFCSRMRSFKPHAPTG